MIFARFVSCFFGVCIVLAWAGCGRSTDGEGGASPDFPTITMQLDWFPEPEHGGFYQAEAKGFYRDAGLNVVLLPGGPNANVLQKLATGVVQFGQSDSTNTIQAIARGLPLINVAAVFQDDPSVLMLHASNPVTKFEDLDGKTIMARPEWVFLPFLRKKYGIDFNLIPQSFGLGQFVADPLFIQQGFYVAEPFFLEREGVVPKFLHTWQAGFEPYVVVAANRPFVETHAEAVRAFLRASVRGWKDYLSDDPNPAHSRMREINEKATPEYLEFSRRMIIGEKLVTGRNGGTENIGRLSKARFEEQIRQLEELGVVESGIVTLEKAMNADLLDSK